MRNVVVQVQGRYAVLMNDMGDFIKIRNNNYKIGQRIENRTFKQKAGYLKFATVAAAVVIMLFGGGAYAYYTPYSYITVDINPSIELEMNVFNRVLNAKAMNEGAEPILEGIDLSGCDINTAAEKIVDELVNDGFIEEGSTAELMVTASSKNKDCADSILKKTMTALNKEIDKKDMNANIRGESIIKEIKEQADEYGVTPGKLLLVELYAQSTDNPQSVDAAEWTEKSVKEILAEIKENKKQEKEQNTDEKLKPKAEDSNCKQNSNADNKDKENTDASGIDNALKENIDEQFSAADAGNGNIKVDCINQENKYKENGNKANNNGKVGSGNSNGNENSYSEEDNDEVK